MRLVGVTLMLFGGAVAWFLGVKGEDLATLRSQIFAFFHVQDPGSILPASVASAAPAVALSSGSTSPRLVRGPQ